MNWLAVWLAGMALACLFNYAAAKLNDIYDKEMNHDEVETNQG